MELVLVAPVQVMVHRTIRLFVWDAGQIVSHATLTQKNIITLAPHAGMTHLTQHPVLMMSLDTVSAPRTALPFGLVTRACLRTPQHHQAVSSYTLIILLMLSQILQINGRMR